MKTLKDLPRLSLICLFTDIDGTLTTDGRIGPQAYSALWKLYKAGIAVVPVTGRPAGWCEMIARTWPVHGVIGENGAFYFRYHNHQMKRHFFIDEKTRTENQKKLKLIELEILKEVPGSAIASDQFSRLFDLAIDFSEDVPALPETAIDKIVSIFKKHGATAKVSNIHVNGWFGHYDKLTACKEYCQSEFQTPFEDNSSKFAFVGDSPNDEPMFAAFEYSFAVANIKTFENRLKHLPAFVSNLSEGEGFAEIISAISQEVS